MAAKVATKSQSQTSQIKPFTARKESQPARTLESLKETVKELDAVAKALLPRAQLSPAITATRAQAKQMTELFQIEAELERLTVALHGKAAAIRADLSAAVDSAGACEIVATSEGLRYCAEPRAGGVSLRNPTVGHTLRQIK